jgi:DNA-binding response OmpR family regulator
VGDGHRPTEVRLTPTEWHLVEVLLCHPGTLLSPRRLLNEVWRPGYETAGVVGTEREPAICVVRRQLPSRSRLNICEGE